MYPMCGMEWQSASPLHSLFTFSYKARTQDGIFFSLRTPVFQVYVGSLTTVVVVDF